MKNLIIWSWRTIWTIPFLIGFVISWLSILFANGTKAATQFYDDAL